MANNLRTTCMKLISYPLVSLVLLSVHSCLVSMKGRYLLWYLVMLATGVLILKKKEILLDQDRPDLTGPMFPFDPRNVAQYET